MKFFQNDELKRISKNWTDMTSGDINLNIIAFFFKCHIGDVDAEIASDNLSKYLGITCDINLF